MAVASALAMISLDICRSLQAFVDIWRLSGRCGRKVLLYIEVKPKVSALRISITTTS